MTYDGMSRRVGVTELHGTTVINAYTYVWCGVNSCQERDGTGHTINKQFFNQGEQINGTNYYFACDHLGSVREMTDSNGVVHANYDYDPFGRQTKLSGDLDSDIGYIEKTLCLDLTMFRVYDPEKGRWLSRDPLGEKVGFNLYEYVNNKTVLYRDLLGLQTSGTPTNTASNNSSNDGSNSNQSSPSCPGSWFSNNFLTWLDALLQALSRDFGKVGSPIPPDTVAAVGGAVGAGVSIVQERATETTLLEQLELVITPTFENIGFNWKR
jgi:RHS repeat-associated protein